MKKTIPILSLFLFLLPAAKSQSVKDLFFSEYVEGTSNTKALEIYNGTPMAVDLSNYTILGFTNGSTISGASSRKILSGTLPAGQTLVVHHPSITLTGVSNAVTFSGWFNGNDAIALSKNGVFVDVFGQIGVDPGASWSSNGVQTVDRTLRRKQGVCLGDTNGYNAFDPSIEWEQFGTNTITGLGSHATNCTANMDATLTASPQTIDFLGINGIPSPIKSYRLITSHTTAQYINISVSGSFMISTSISGPFFSQLDINTYLTTNLGMNIYVFNNNTTTGIYTGNILHTTQNLMRNTTLTANIIDASSVNYTPIYDIQGKGFSSTMSGISITTTGIVTADFQENNQMKGFFLQDENGDADSQTSDGIFVFHAATTVNKGDKVMVAGTVAEFNGLTELKDISLLFVLSSGHSLAPKPIGLPVTSDSTMEQVEGMLVTVPQELTVTQNYFLGRYGRVVLSARGRLANPTNYLDVNDIDPNGNTTSGGSNLAVITAQQNLNFRKSIVMDDGSTIQNPVPVPYLDAIDNTIRTGSTVVSLTGVVDYFAPANAGFEDLLYHIHPVSTVNINYAPRPTVPGVGSPNVKIASFNVLNYFNGNGTGGGYPTPRGADNAIEFDRQRVKIINAISQINADALGLMEMENDGEGSTSAIQDLINGLNSVSGANTYDFVRVPTPSGILGTDEIKVAFIYKPAILSLVGTAMSDQDPIYSRPPLAQTFSVKSNGALFSLIVNHFKSKGCTDASGLDTDQGDGQGCYNDKRKQQALAITRFVQSIAGITTNDNVLIIGDLNAYEQEDPIDILRNSGLQSLLNNTYSYVFDGAAGSLDHAIGTPQLAAAVTGAAKWHINADEPSVLDYNTEFGKPLSLYKPDPFRSSDHDPVLVGLSLQPVMQTVAGINPSVTFTGSILTVSGSADLSALYKSTSTAQVVFNSANNNIASIAGTNLIAINTGVVLVTASQSSIVGFNGIQSTATFTVVAGVVVPPTVAGINPSVTFTGQVLTVGGAADLLTLFVSDSPALVSFSSSRPDIGSIVNGQLSALANGTVTVTGSQLSITGFNAISKSAVFTIVSEMVVITTTGLSANEDIGRIKIYPNPCADSFINITEIASIVICDIAGKKVSEADNMSKIDISHLPKGIYLLTVRGYKTFRLIRE